MSCNINDRFKILTFETAEEYLKKKKIERKIGKKKDEKLNNKCAKNYRIKIEKKHVCQKCGVKKKQLRWTNNGHYCCDQCILEEVVNLTIPDFEYYFEKYRLGKLCFPVGSVCDNYGCSIPFFISLSDLYRLIIEWKTDEQKNNIQELEIIAVIAFGSAVGPKERTIEKIKSKFIFWGPESISYQEICIQPNDADFLIITKKAMIEEKVLKPISVRTYDCGTCIKKGGIHLVNRSVEQCRNGILEGDTISVSALSEGIPIFYNNDFVSLRDELSVPNQSLYGGVTWKINSKEKLKGEIQ